MFEHEHAERRLLDAHHGISRQQLGRHTRRALAAVVQNKNAPDAALSETALQHLPEPIHVRLKSVVEFSGFGNGALDDVYAAIAQRRDHDRAVGIDFTERENVLALYSQGNECFEEIDRLPEHVLHGDDGRVFAEIEIRGPCALRECACYVEQRQLWFSHGLCIGFMGLSLRTRAISREPFLDTREARLLNYAVFLGTKFKSI